MATSLSKLRCPCQDLLLHLIQVIDETHWQEGVGTFALIPLRRLHSDVRERLRPPGVSAKRHSVRQVLLEKLRRFFQALDVILLDATKKLAES
jgi:hypothetical protein